MKIACLCPTYGRPQALIENTIACFLAQTHEEKFLYILDDTPRREYRDSELPDNILFSMMDPREKSLASKYNRMLTTLSSALWFPVPDAIAVWEDDDVYLPNHLASMAEAMRWQQRSEDRFIAEVWAKPSQAWSTYTGSPQLEDAAGRFHASWGARWQAIEEVGGWPDTKRADFDQQLLAKMQRQWGRPRPMPPTYVFRWADSGARHGQELMRAPDDETWYDRFEPQNTEPFVNLTPRFDDSTKAIFAELNIPLPELQGAMA